MNRQNERVRGPMSINGVHTAPPEPRAVAAFLRAHPAWLAENPDIYRLLTPPVRVHGDVFADHMAAMLAAARAETRALLASERVARDLTGRVEHAVLALIAADDPLGAIAAELPPLLGVDTASLCIEAEIAGAHTLPPGMVARLLDGVEVRLRDRPNLTEATLLHAEAAALARYDALIGLPGTAVPAMLVLASRDAFARPAAGARAPLALLGRAVAASLARA